MAFNCFEMVWEVIRFKDVSNMAENDTSKIVGLLNHGPFWGIRFKKILISYILLATFFLLMMSIGIYIFTIDQLENPDSTILFVLVIVLWIVVVSLMPIILLILIIRNEKKRRQVQLWMEDAVLLQAESKEIGRKNQLGLFPCVKLQIDFDIDGIHYSRFSESPSPKGEKGGYYFIWSRYANRKLHILYSFKYDQVMILNS